MLQKGKDGCGEQGKGVAAVLICWGADLDGAAVGGKSGLPSMACASCAGAHGGGSAGGVRLQGEREGCGLGCWGCAAGVVRLMVEEIEELVIRVVEIGLG